MSKNDKVYVVVDKNGSWDEFTAWNVCASLDKADAELVADRLTGVAKRLQRRYDKAYHDDGDLSNFRKDLREEAARLGDPGMQFVRNDPARYEVEELPLAEDL